MLSFMSQGGIPLFAVEPPVESTNPPRSAQSDIPKGPGRGEKSLSVFLVEDEFIILAELEAAFREEGAHVASAVASVAAAWEFLASGGPVDLAVLDINLRGKTVYELADALLSRGARVAFVTGYDCSTLPERFAGCPCFGKPISLRHVADLLALR